MIDIATLITESFTEEEIEIIKSIDYIICKMDGNFYFLDMENATFTNTTLDIDAIENHNILCCTIPVIFTTDYNTLVYSNSEPINIEIFKDAILYIIRNNTPIGNQYNIINTTKLSADQLIDLMDIYEVIVPKYKDGDYKNKKIKNVESFEKAIRNQRRCKSMIVHIKEINEKYINHALPYELSLYLHKILYQLSKYYN